MKFTLSWLREHWEGDAALETLLLTLSTIGLEVEGVENRGAALAAFRTARIVEAVRHPNADRLQVCTVDDGAKMLNVVCGAPNARAGLRVVLAKPGAVIPASGETLRQGEIRGVVSEGMMCSARELGLGAEHDGILELPPETAPGQSLAAVLGLDEPVIEIAVTPNRGDCLGVRGVARDLAAAGLGRLKPWRPVPVRGDFPSPVEWEIAVPQDCPWILGRGLRGVTNGPSPEWLAERLTAVGLRPINRLVDITNYFCIDLGRPLHAFDADKLAGGSLRVRRGAGEDFRALNGKTYRVEPEDCVIADGDGVVSIAGVMGEATGCTEATTRVFIECALFDPVRVALTGRRLAIGSDARARFERGLDPSLPADALEAATRMVLALCGGEASRVSLQGGEPQWGREATLRFERLARFGGAAITADEAVLRLERLGFGVVHRSAARVTVAVPPWRTDIAQSIVLDQAPGLDPARAALAATGAAEIEPEADLIEEVLRLGGMDAIAPLPLPRPLAQPVLSPRQQRVALARRVLAAGGLFETVRFSFVSHAQAALFGEAPASLRLINPIAQDLDQMRPTPVLSLSLGAERNQARGFPGSRLFEIGPAFDATGQHPVVAILRAGLAPGNWLAPARAWDAFDAKRDVFAVLSAFGIAVEALIVTADAPRFYHPGRSGVVRQGPKLILARFGELHPRLRAALGLDQVAVAAELFLDAIPEGRKRRKAGFEPLPLQPVRRDFAFVVAADVSAEALLRAVRGAEKALVTGVTLFDVYALPDGRRSLAVEVTLQPRDRSFTDAEIASVSSRIVAAAATTGAALR